MVDVCGQEPAGIPDYASKIRFVPVGLGAIVQRLARCGDLQGSADTVVADRSGSTAAEDREVSEKSPAGAAIRVLAFSGRADGLFWGPGWRKPGWNPPIQGVQVQH